MSGFLEGLTEGAGTAVKYAGIYVLMDVALYAAKSIIDECRSRAHFRATGADVWSAEKVGKAFEDRLEDTLGCRRKRDSRAKDSAPTGSE